MNTETVPLEQALAGLDSPSAVADRRRRAKKMAEALEGHERGRVIYAAGTQALGSALAPLTVAQRSRFTAAEIAQAEREAGEGVDALVARYFEEHLRITDEWAVYNDPDRLESLRCWQSYTSSVSSIAWAQGNKADAFIARWQELIRDRATVEEYGDSTAAIDQRLERLVGVPYPKLPDAAWVTADALPLADRQAEYDRLEVKYGPRKPEGQARLRGRKKGPPRSGPARRGA